MRRFFILLILLYSQGVLSVELYGVAIETTERAQFREAIRNSGAEVVREAGEDNWYDVYNVSENFGLAKRMFVAYEKANGRFAFVEYHLSYENLRPMLRKLNNKYGKATVSFGRFESDKTYQWQQDGVEIKLSQDWHKNISRLVYNFATNSDLLVQAYQQAQQTKQLAKLQQGNNYY